MSDKKSRKERRFRSKAVTVVVATIFVLVSLSAVLAACGGDGDEGNGDNGAATGDSSEAMAEERAAVEDAIKRYFERTGRTTMTSRPLDIPRPLGAWDTDAPFRGDLKVRMPTRFLYTWDENGTLTSVTEPAADE